MRQRVAAYVELFAFVVAAAVAAEPTVVQFDPFVEPSMTNQCMQLSQDGSVADVASGVCENNMLATRVRAT